MNTHELNKLIKAKETRLNKLEKQFSKTLSQSQTAIFDSMNNTQSLFDDNASQHHIIEKLKKELKADKEKLINQTLAFLQSEQTKNNFKLDL